MLSFIFVLVGLSVLVVVHELGHFLAAKFFKMRVDEFGVGFPPKLLWKKIGETIYSLNLVPLGGFVKIYGEDQGVDGEMIDKKKSFAYRSAYQRAIVLLAGVLMNFMLGWFFLFLVLVGGSETKVVIDRVFPNSPAAVAGIVAGDRLVGFKSAEEFVNETRSHLGVKMSFRVISNAGERGVTLVPRVSPPAGEGALGISITGVGLEKQPFLPAIYKSFQASIEVVAQVFSGFYYLFISPQDVVGPVGIVKMAADTSKLGLAYFLQFLALLSLNLAVLNVLPIPALDGGRLLFVIIEKIRGKKMKPVNELRANAIGFGLLILLILIVTLKDIRGLF